MKTNLIRIASLAVVAFGVSALGNSESVAASYYDEDSYGPLVIGSGTTYSSSGGAFNITSSNNDNDGDDVGYNPLGSETLLSAFVSFTFNTGGAGDITSTVVVKLDGEQVSDPGLNPELEPIYSFVSGSLSLSGWVTLLADGILEFTIKNDGTSDLVLNTASLLVERGDALPSVPDAGATAILFGTFSLAALAMRRRLGKIA